MKLAFYMVACYTDDTIDVTEKWKFKHIGGFMELGNVIKKDICHPDLCKKTSIFLDGKCLLFYIII